ncbi:MAG: dipeptidase [Prosthecobacter sp.]|uniref:dipeptidase n=1 Tax=Prosthecobacter sp. TaxID=1965333 RepID=UPI0038FF8B50
MFLTTLAQAQDLDIDKLIRDSFVVDSEGTYYQRNEQSGESDPFATADGTRDFGKLKEYCGRNLTVMNVSGERSLDVQVEDMTDGTYKNAVVVKTFGDIAALRTSRKFGALFYIQTWDPLGGSVEKIAQWHRKGLRVFNIAYGRGHNPAKEDLLGYGSGETGGLTPMGEKVVAELNRLKMVVDVAHANDETTIDVCRVAKAPVVATHANCRAVTQIDRNKSDQALKAIAKTGGVIGITTIGWMIEDASGKRDVDAFVKHIEHLRRQVGIDHIGLASDAYLNGWATGSNHYACPELAAPDRWKTVAKALAAKGYKTEDIQKILGLNWVRAFKAILPP